MTPGHAAARHAPRTGRSRLVRRRAREHRPHPPRRLPRRHGQRSLHRRRHPRTHLPQHLRRLLQKHDLRRHHPAERLAEQGPHPSFKATTSRSRASSEPHLELALRKAPPRRRSNESLSSTRLVASRGTHLGCEGLARRTGPDVDRALGRFGLPGVQAVDVLRFKLRVEVLWSKGHQQSWSERHSNRGSGPDRYPPCDSTDMAGRVRRDHGHVTDQEFTSRWRSEDFKSRSLDHLGRLAEVVLNSEPESNARLVDLGQALQPLSRARLTHRSIGLTDRVSRLQPVEGIGRGGV